MASLSTLAPAVSITRDERGTHIDIPAGVSIDEPIIVAYDVADPALIAHTFVTAGEGARATIIERLTGATDRDISSTPRSKRRRVRTSRTPSCRISAPA